MQPSMDPFTTLYGSVLDLLAYGRNLAVAILAAAAVGSAIGEVWYATTGVLKGRLEAQETPGSELQPVRAPGRSAAEFIGALLAAFFVNLIVALVLAVLFAGLRGLIPRGTEGGLTIGFVVWVVSLGATLSSGTFSRRLKPPVWNDVVYSLVLYLVMGLIIGAVIVLPPQYF